MSLKTGEAIGMINPQDRFLRSGDSVWFRKQVQFPRGQKQYELCVLNLKTYSVNTVNPGLPARFANNLMYHEPSINYLYFSGNNVYFIDDHTGSAGQLYKMSLSGRDKIKISFPDMGTLKFRDVYEVVQTGKFLIVKATYQDKKSFSSKTFSVDTSR